MVRKKFSSQLELPGDGKKKKKKELKPTVIPKDKAPKATIKKETPKEKVKKSCCKKGRS